MKSATVYRGNVRTHFYRVSKVDGAIAEGAAEIAKRIYLFFYTLIFHLGLLQFAFIKHG